MRLWKKFNGEPFMINPKPKRILFKRSKHGKHGKQIAGIQFYSGGKETGRHAKAARRKSKAFFDENPQIGILGLGLNPRRKKRGKKVMARRSSRAHMAYVRSFRKNARRHRRRSYRRNPYPVAGVALNPRRRRRHRRNPSIQNRRRYRRNPGGKRIFGLSLPPLQSVLYAGVGFVAVPVTEGFLNQFLPLSITSTTLGKYAIRIGSVIGLTWLGKMILGKQAAMMVGIGGGAYVLVTAVKEFAPGMIPGLSAYAQPALGAYTPSSGRNYRTLGAPQVLPFQASSQATASRFRRF